MKYIFFILLASLSCSSTLVFAENFSGPVVSILDGDTIEVLHKQHAERIRFSGIDCPEKGQAYGQKAKHAASALAFGKEVILQTHGKDKYGRTLADVILQDGLNVNRTLVSDGWCWWYRKYAPGDTELEQLEKRAREARKGLWVDPAPIPPWVYRKTRRGLSLEPSDLLPLEADTEGKTSSHGPPQPGQVQPNPLPETSLLSYRIIGNHRSHIYHRPDCPNYSQVALPNRVEFNNATEAEAAGYRRAGNCP